MGRLFWKFFLFIWLGQMAAVLGTGALFWIDRHRFLEHPGSEMAMPHEHRPAGFRDQPPARENPEARREYLPPQPPPPPNDYHLPVLPILAGLLASLLCAAGLAWYIAKPIRHLRQAFDAAAEGNLTVRVSSKMGGRRDELADLGNDFDRMTAHLQALIAGQKRLLHDVSHEMRSPLARLQAAIGLARQQPARVEDSLQRIERESERMNVLVGELLTLSRLDAGVASPQENIEMGDLLADIVEDARFEGTARQVTVRYTPGRMAEIRANPELLHRAIENVLRNALRFSPPGGEICISAGATTDGRFHLAIGDAGPGVAADQLEHIFKPFFRGEGQASANGYGLGLAIAHRVIAAVNGKIEAKNKGSGGLLVDIELPLAKLS